MKKLMIALMAIIIPFLAYQGLKGPYASHVAKKDKEAVIAFQNSDRYDAFKGLYAPNGFPHGTACIRADEFGYNYPDDHPLRGKRVVTFSVEDSVETNKTLVDIHDDGSLEGVLEGKNKPCCFPGFDESSPYRPVTSEEQAGWKEFRTSDTKPGLLRAAEGIGVKSGFEKSNLY